MTLCPDTYVANALSYTHATQTSSYEIEVQAEEASSAGTVDTPRASGAQMMGIDHVEATAYTIKVLNIVSRILSVAVEGSSGNGPDAGDRSDSFPNFAFS